MRNSSFLKLTVLLFCFALNQISFSIDFALLNKPAPAFDLAGKSDGEEKQIQLSSYKGKLILLNFWASWCGPCRAELPTLIKLQKKFQDRNFTIIGIAVEDEPFVKKFLEDEKIKINYPITFGKIKANKLIEKYGNPDGMLPYSVLISPKQEVLSIYPGILSEAKMERVLGRLLDSF